MEGATHARLQIDQDGPGDVSRVVALVVEDILAVAAFCREVFEVPVLADAVLLAQLLPELAADFWLSVPQPSTPPGGSTRALVTDCCCRIGRPGL